MMLSLVALVLIGALFATAAPPPSARDECQGMLECPPPPALPLSSVVTPAPATTTLPTCFYLTNDYNWSGEGLNLCNLPGECSYQVPDGLSANISSAGPDRGAVCFLYSDVNCQGETSVPMVYPGHADLREVSFDKEARSWRCWKLVPDNFATVAGGAELSVSTFTWATGVGPVFASPTMTS